ncbi:right-handed parallel beta-helix repeat-containing protein [Candidatus Bipolaricaulota bacterium]|nr:right-handed parallel beta-helix repeat-containing protein [Candidatus Bipolaricaulota bacterium]
MDCDFANWSGKTEVSVRFSDQKLQSKVCSKFNDIYNKDMFNIRRRNLFFIILIVGAISVIPVQPIKAVNGDFIDVCSFGCNYERIQPAIDAASPGGKILVKSLTVVDVPFIQKYLPVKVFKANLDIDKPLTIKASVPHHIVIKPEEDLKSVISMGSGAKGVKLEGLDIVGSGGKRCTRAGMPKCPTGISVKMGANLTLSDCSVSNNGGFGLEVRDSATVNVLQSKIASNKTGGILYGRGTKGKVINSTIIDNGRGVVSYSDKVEGENNEFRKNGTPLVGNLDPSFRNKLNTTKKKQIIYDKEEYPTLQHAVDALKPEGIIYVVSGEYDDAVTVDKNMSIVAMRSAFVILESEKTFSTGISMIGDASLEIHHIQLSAGSTGMTVAGNSSVTAEEMNFYGNGNGVVLLNSADATIKDSKFYFNCYAGILLRDSASLKVIDNDFYTQWAGIMVKEPKKFSGSIEGWNNNLDGNKNKLLNMSEELKSQLMGERDEGETNKSGQLE